jgi:hypothetical protein
MDNHDATLEQPTAGLPFLLKWIAATGGGVMAGFAATALLSGLTGYNFTSYSPSLAVQTLLAVGASGAILGLVLGAAQWLAIRRHLPGSLGWIPATAVGFALLQEVALLAEVWVDSPSIYSTLGLVIAWDVLKALMGGVALGFAQWVVLARRISRAWLWIIALPLAFGVGTAYVSGILRISGALQAAFSGNGVSVGGLLWVLTSGLLLFSLLSGTALLGLLNWNYRAARMKAEAEAGAGADAEANAEGVAPAPPKPVSRRSAWAVGAFVVVAVIAVAAVGLASLDAMRNPPRINISRSDYEQALAKWRAQNVAEYVIATETRAFLGGDTKLRVSNGGKDVVVLEPAPSSTPSPEYIEHFRADTVEGMFADIEAMLDDNEVVHSPAVTSMGGFYMAYTVRFHPELGYPTYLEGHPVTEPGSHVFDADWKKTVKELTIVRQAVPTPGAQAP